jgi:hypothetical protein
VRPVVVHGRPAELLLVQAGEAQLVVVGTRSRGAAARALLGSTSRGLLRHSPCPVAVVRPGITPARLPSGRQQDRAQVAPRRDRQLGGP